MAGRDREEQTEARGEDHEVEQVGAEGVRLVHLGNEIRCTDIEEVAGCERDQPAHVEP
jgi:hypothetical protein